MYIGFAIPSNIAREVFTQLKTHGHVHRAQLGLVAETITPEMAEGLELETDHGVIVSDVRSEGAADHAGVKVDDIIVSLNGQPMTTVHQLNANVYRLAPGTKITLGVQRGAERFELPVIAEKQSGEELDTLADAVDPVKNIVPELGIVGLDINKAVLELLPDLRRPSGVVVAARQTNAPYSGPPLQTGDAIYAVNRQVVANVAQLRHLLDGIKSGQPAVLLIEREGHLMYLPLALD